MLPTGFPGYLVTEDGRVFSVQSNWRGYGQRELTQGLNEDGYPCVRLTVEGKRLRRTVHSLVAYAYLPPKPSELHEIRHLDGDKMNPNFDNLAWGTKKENADDREQHGRTSRGSSHGKTIRASGQAEGTRAFRKAQRELRASV